MQVKAKARSGGRPFQPAHDLRPVFPERPLSHEQSEMIAGRYLVAEMLRRRSNQPLQRQQLFASHHFVGAAGQQIDGKPQARELDPLPKRDEVSGGQFIALV